MPDPLCHATQGGIMLVAPFITKIRKKRTLWILASIGAIFGDLPDLLGAFGYYLLNDHGNLYYQAHWGHIREFLQYVPMYGLHLVLDHFTHRMEDRWTLWNHWVEFELVAWAINISLIILLAMVWRRMQDRRRAAMRFHMMGNERD